MTPNCFRVSRISLPMPSGVYFKAVSENVTVREAYTTFAFLGKGKLPYGNNVSQERCCSDEEHLAVTARGIPPRVPEGPGTIEIDRHRDEYKAGKRGGGLCLNGQQGLPLG